ncbi:hypothetical protein NNJEOMEG_03785 [Fundidesulfovibrio magnetotacticus]|uniref:Uncharacterized protein n=1 Tax=Fundidesulfovibrio magnetotacticus TaxID=2730080 RepID=A0A6V8LTW2_9BACT|nr:hypothetical protein [Fundidesulfovibrio magnetotacticus]GFK95912.1 hypothetical protein NNJEOMEG_03785 [Fundidesulfovibrio magnetotacticus]
MPYPTPTGAASALNPADQQALKRLRYERALDVSVGISPEESQFPEAYAQQPQAGFDPMGQQMRFQQGQAAPGQFQPAQQAQPGPRSMPGSGAVPPFQDILRAVIAQPGMAHHLEGIDLDGDGIPDVPPPPMDPMARMQWQAMVQNRQLALQAAMARRAKRKDVNNNVLLSVLQSADPLFGEIYTRLSGYVNSLPVKVRRPYMEAVERTPGAFLELYGHLREGLLSELGVNREMPTPMPQPGGADPRARIRQAVAGRMSPPDLARAGVLDDDRPARARDAAELAALKSRVKAGQAREGDLLRYLELSGV